MDDRNRSRVDKSLRALMSLARYKAVQATETEREVVGDIMYFLDNLPDDGSYSTQQIEDLVMYAKVAAEIERAIARRSVQ